MLTLKHQSISLALFFMFSTNVLSQGVEPENLCKREAYVVGFFNGVWTTELDAQYTAEKFRAEFGRTFRGEPVDYESFYNTSGTDPNSDATAFQDIAEVFIQRANEIEPNLGENFEIFWSAVSGNSDGFLDKVESILLGTADAVFGLVSDLYTEISTESAALVSRLLSNPPTQEDYARHSLRINTLALQGNKLLLVAHSQGNLFVQNAYETAIGLESYSQENIGVVHIAPASSITYGPHILANIDVVINALRVFGGHTVPSVTVDLPISHLKVDPSGHMIWDTYLNESLIVEGEVLSKANSELTRLVTPEQIGQNGSFTVTMAWNGSGDADLHAVEPSGEHVNWDNQVGDVGFLDVDNVIGEGPEHYYATCDASKLLSGNYQIGVVNYLNAQGRLATIQVSTPYVADLKTITTILGQSAGDASLFNPPFQLVVNVSRDNEGKIVITSFD